MAPLDGWHRRPRKHVLASRRAVVLLLAVGAVLALTGARLGAGRTPDPTEGAGAVVVVQKGWSQRLLARNYGVYSWGVVIANRSTTIRAGGDHLWDSTGMTRATI